MPDQISNYRQVRLIITPGHYSPLRSHWNLNAVVVRNGVPYATYLCGGTVPELSRDATAAQIREAVCAVGYELEQRRYE